MVAGDRRARMRPESDAEQDAERGRRANVALTRPQTKDMNRRRSQLVAAVGAAAMALLALALAVCSGPTPTANNPNSLTLAQIPWCDQPSIAFQDDGKLSHPLLSDWSVVQGQLGFTPYLPTTLPKGACLALVGGTIHDPVLVGHFRITYAVPSSGPLSFSEAPKQASVPSTESGKVQCSSVASSGTPPAAAGTPGATPVPPLSICVGTIGNTNISVASAESSSDLQQLFNSLQPNVNWVPQGTGTPTATPKS